MSIFNGLRGIFREKKIARPCPSAGGGGTGEAERRNGRKRRSRGEDRSWGKLSAASDFLQSIVARHAPAEIATPDIRRPPFALGRLSGARTRLFHRAGRSRGKRRRAQNEQRVARARNDGVGSARVAAEFDKGGGFVEGLDDGDDLATNEPVLRQVAEKRDSAEEIAPGSLRSVVVVIMQPRRLRSVGSVGRSGKAGMGRNE